MTEPQQSHRRRFCWVAVVPALAVLGGLGLALSWTNLREVDPGRFYRSGQLNSAQLQGAIDELGIRTVINLRGRGDDEPWYREESEVARNNGVQLVDVLFRSKRLPHRADLIALLDAYRDAERPILVHCYSGADRAGQASAIYQMEYMGRPKSEALEMLSLRFGHFSWLKPAMHYFVEVYEGEAWARREYDPCRAGYRHYNRALFCGG
jgi:protein tyrosine phosphatase (PTP) superfamily phosphohydrolase (DUF442 family)